MKIRIFDVGRMKKSTEIVVDDSLGSDEVADEVLRAVHRMRALMSRGVEVEWYGDESKGIVLAGMRIVGYAEEVR